LPELGTGMAGSKNGPHGRLPQGVAKDLYWLLAPGLETARVGRGET